MAQCLQYLQFLQARQFLAPVQVAVVWVYWMTVKERRKAERVRVRRVRICFFMVLGFSN